MTDEQLQSLFAGMERHLDRRFDIAKEGLGESLAAIETRIDAKLEKLETTLLTEFHKWASPVDAKLRTHRSNPAMKLDGDKPAQ